MATGPQHSYTLSKGLNLHLGYGTFSTPHTPPVFTAEEELAARLPGPPATQDFAGAPTRV